MNLEKRTQKEIKFPVLCHYRIIALDMPHVPSLINEVLLKMGIHSQISRGNLSSQGKYVSFSVDINVSSREMMFSIDKNLRKIDGIKMVL